ncbi:MAG: OmpH family outer membrane protein [Lentisphaeria bacterium]|nr:OmpH family outer membrane protein [Lentisphaeria bacterium]
MKNFFKSLLAVLLVCWIAAVSAEDRIGVVDLEKIFREYHKSRSVENFINQRAEAVRAYLTQLQKQLNELRASARKLGTDAVNPALSESEKLITQKNADEALRKVRAKEAEIQLYVTEVSRERKELERKKRAEIMADIHAEIKRRAAVRGFNFIIDKSGRTLNDQPALLLFPAGRDISDEVIRELNRTAPKNKTEVKK